jgi:hypothetical protein
MNAAKNGYVAEFKTGYLQRELIVEATVSGGTDKGLRDANKEGFAPGRLVVFNGTAITAAANVSATSIGTATHIIAQSDDTIRDLPEDCNYTERYSTLPNCICKNSTTEKKTVALYRIVNADDVKIINLG